MLVRQGMTVSLLNVSTPLDCILSYLPVGAVWDLQHTLMADAKQRDSFFYISNHYIITSTIVSLIPFNHSHQSNLRCNLLSMGSLPLAQSIVLTRTYARNTAASACASHAQAQPAPPQIRLRPAGARQDRSKQLAS